MNLIDYASKLNWKHTGYTGSFSAGNYHGRVASTKQVLLLSMGLLSIITLAICFWPKQTAAVSYYNYTQDRILRFFKSRDLEITHYFSIRRNGTGNKLYVSPHGGLYARTVMIASTSGVELVKAPGRIVFLSGADEFVAWSDDLQEGIRFRNGYLLQLPRHALFDVDPSGEYFLVGEKPFFSWIGRTDSPEERTCVSSVVSNK